jgi:hypothetical protein
MRNAKISTGLWNVARRVRFETGVSFSANLSITRIPDGWEVEVKIANVAGSELPEIEFSRNRVSGEKHPQRSNQRES